MDGLRDESGVAPLERLPASETARPLPVFGALRSRSVPGTSTSCRDVVFLAVGGPIGGGPVFAKSCQTRSRSGTRVAIRGDVWEGGAVGTRRDLVGSEILQYCCQRIENEAHDVKGRNESEKGEVIK